MARTKKNAGFIGGFGGKMRKRRATPRKGGFAAPFGGSAHTHKNKLFPSTKHRIYNHSRKSGGKIKMWKKEPNKGCPGSGEAVMPGPAP